MLDAAELDSVDDEVWGLYLDSFSDVERIPRANMDRALRSGATLVKYIDGGRFIGFTFSFSHRDMSFFVYFATVPGVRGGGYGSEILDMFRRSNQGKRVFLVTEPCDRAAEDYSLRVRRQGFYRRNGCVGTGKTIVSDGEAFDTMFVQGRLSDDEMESVVRLYEDIHNGRCESL